METDTFANLALAMDAFTRYQRRVVSVDAVQIECTSVRAYSPSGRYFGVGGMPVYRIDFTCSRFEFGKTEPIEYVHTVYVRAGSLRQLRHALRFRFGTAQGEVRGQL